ncbi:DsbC family protein [Hydrogenobacter hydrogenophilus]|uniref:Thiol:disulfide interchange protein DsbC n=1 Tax=Hydrogenobacter hydrogenophilus TaxID=35835 RepID=A0A285NSG8_9AQUI|nr:DsbC family protein [Hydrogenobacter hydrogenophilus]SNZ12138.1 Thiol:disulfide interchange protein DsbC [Hydrogenobacter hydrogenophilus]
MIKKFGFLALGVLAVMSAQGCGTGSAKCPSKDTVKNAVKDLIPQDFTVESVSNVSNISGLCEVVVKVGAQPIVFYTDSNAQYVIAGNLISIKDKKNITRERQQEFMKVSNDLLKELEKHVNFTYGQGSKFIYYITDPDCPFCKKSEPIIEEWAKKNNVQVKVILFPLPIHPDAFGKSVALVCDKKGWNELVKGYDSKNQCEDGKKKVSENLQFLSQLGVNGTPTFIGMNGKMQSGVPTEEDLNKLIN